MHPEGANSNAGTQATIAASSKSCILNPCGATAVSSALEFISDTLASRLSPLAASENLGDVWEALTAAVYLLSSPSNQLFVSKESRARSFTQGGWHRLANTQTVEQMVESGFYYLQEDDHVKCFFCDLGLKDWEVGDSPELEHARFSPLCFFLKSSRGLDWLRLRSQRAPNYPTSYTRQDHNQLLRHLADQLYSQPVSTVSKLGFSRSKLLLCVARKFIRFRQKFSREELLVEMQREWDREFNGEPELFTGSFELAEALDHLMERSASISEGTHGSSIPSQSTRADSSLQTAAVSRTSAVSGNKCRSCNIKEVEVVCLPCGHLSLCGQCARTVLSCPAMNCGSQIDTMVRAFVS